MTSSLGVAVGLLSIELGVFTNFKCMSFLLHGCCGDWEGWALNRLTTPVG